MTTDKENKDIGGKKRLFIAIQYLDIGGAERSLIGLLNAIDYAKYEVDLFVYEHRGEFMKLIPAQVNLLPEIPAYAAINKPMKEALRSGQWGIVWGRLLARWKNKRFVRRTHAKQSIAAFQYVAEKVLPYLPSLKRYGTYDLAISFLIPHHIVRSKVDARQKWCWIHTDYSYVDVDAENELPVWDAYDKIVSISPDVTKAFLSKFPSLKDKILEMENILSERFVREQAEEKVSDFGKADDAIRILSVGRLSYPKAFDRAVLICKGLIDKGLNVRWYIVGYGDAEAEIRQAITENGMDDRFVLLGKRTNPYPYIKACDIYAQPSRYEGKAVTVREAQILCRPVVITHYATAPSQVIDGKDGIIVPNEVEGAVAGMAELIQNPQQQQELIDYLRSHHYGNEDEVRKIDKYL